MDRSSGYEGISKGFLVRRGNDSTRSNAIGVKEVRNWARRLARGSSVIDLGCGPGLPITVVLVEEGLNVFAVDGSPSFVTAFRRNLPNVPVVCDSVLETSFFDRTFDAVLAWGLMFLLDVEDQRRLIRRFADLLVPSGRLLFTSPAKHGRWKDVMTDLESISLGAEEYRKQLQAAGLTIADEYEDEGENHYFEAVKHRNLDY